MGVHLGVQALRSGEVDVAVAGGVFVLSTPEFYLSAGAAGMLSPSGRCAAFSAGADGFVPGEGVGVVVLKRLSDAVADGDVIYGVVQGTGLNQDGASNGITAPSVGAQEALLRSVYTECGVRPSEVQLVEAHGTGTALGDPVEFAALSRVFGADSDAPGWCALGTVKTNIGHTASAAGVAGLLKLLWGMRHRQIPPVLHFAGPNPQVALDGSPFYVNTDVRAWPVGANGRRVAAVSAFGFSGTNAHVCPQQEATAAPEGAGGRRGRDASAARRDGFRAVAGVAEAARVTYAAFARERSDDPARRHRRCRGGRAHTPRRAAHRRRQSRRTGRPRWNPWVKGDPRPV